MNIPKLDISRSAANSLQITLLYALGAALWILFSDLLFGLNIREPGVLAIAGTIKGWVFVGVTAFLMYTLLQRVKAKMRPVDNRAQAVPQNNRALYWYTGVAIALIILAGVESIRGLVDRQQQQSIARLQAIADLKADQVGRWIHERMHNAELIRTYTPLGKALRDLRQNDNQASRDIAAQQLSVLQRLMDFQSISVTDSNGNFLLGAGIHGPLSPMLRQAIDAAFATDEVQFTNLYGDAGDEQLHFGFVVTLADDAELALVMLLDENSSLFHFLQDWPLHSTSGETLLFLPDGDSVLFINALRYYNGQTPRPRVPFSKDNMLAVQVANGKVVPGKPIFGVDYRGRQVIGVAKNIPDTNWYLTTKVDQEEIYLELGRDLFWLGIALFMALISVVAGALLLLQRKQLHLAAVRLLDQAENKVTRFNRVLEHSLNEIYILDVDTLRYIEVNLGARTNLGYTLDELRCMTPVDIKPEYTAESFADLIAPLRAGAEQQITFTANHQRKDGSCYPAEVHLEIVDGEQPVFISFILDITERRRVETTLRESETHLRTLIETIPDIVWVKDSAGVYLSCNRRFEDFFGAKSSEIIGKTDYDFVDRELADFFREKDRAAMVADRPSINEEEVTYANDGHKETLETIKMPMFDSDGRLIGVLGIARNITARKQAEIELATQLDELRRWQEVIIGREMRGLELKAEVNELLAQLGQPPHYTADLESEAPHD